MTASPRTRESRIGSYNNNIDLEKLFCDTAYGRSVRREVEVEDQAGHVTLAPMRFIALYSTQLAQQHEQSYRQAQAREAQALATHIAQVQSRPFACEADAQGAIAEYEGQRPGRRGRAATPWRYHEVHYHVQAHRQRQKRAGRGRPDKVRRFKRKWCISSK